MPVMNGVLEHIISEGERRQTHKDSDYIDDDGFLCCGVCRERKQTELSLGYLRGRKLPCLCACERERQSFEENRKRQEQINFRKERCFSHEELRNCTFANDNGRQPKLSVGRRYADNWEKVRENNIGLLLLGGVGTGKSYCACAIANDLCEKDVPVKFANLAEILNALQNNPDRNGYIQSLTRFSLLIIDDFGIQRQTEYALEQVFNLIDNRSRSGKPLIVTTNLTLDEFKHPENTAQERIYDRILEMCTPVVFEGQSMRTGKRLEKRTLLAQILKGEMEPHGTTEKERQNET